MADVIISTSCSIEAKNVLPSSLRLHLLIVLLEVLTCFNNIYDLALFGHAGKNKNTASKAAVQKVNLIWICNNALYAKYIWELSKL